jgi:uncharacterized cupin superfamily protein
MTDEARLEQTEGGLEPVTDGWFVVNVRDATWWRNDAFGAGAVFEGSLEGKEARFREFGINIQVVWPGEPNCMYHAEDAQEDMLVLSGECLLLVEGQERRLEAWDLVHLPPNTRHVFVGAGDGPCAILMVGTRKDPETLLYPVDGLAQKHGAGVDEETPSPREAYAKYPRSRRERLADTGLPWQR